MPWLVKDGVWSAAVADVRCARIYDGERWKAAFVYLEDALKVSSASLQSEREIQGIEVSIDTYNRRQSSTQIQR